MCYFIKIKLNENFRPFAKEKELFLIAKKYGFSKWHWDTFPEYYLDDGHCSCDFIKGKGNKLSFDLNYFQEILEIEGIDEVSVGWNWGEELSDECEMVYIHLKDFISKNTKAQLALDTWYVLYNSKKYY